MNNDKRFRNLLTKIGTGKYKTEKAFKSTPLAELEDMNKDLTKEEAKVAEAAYHEIQEEYLYDEAMNSEPMDLPDAN